MQKSKPRVFVGSSAEGLKIAETIQLGLEHDAEVTVWSQGVFDLTRGALESLVSASKNFDFAILVLTPDDVSLKRGVTANMPRDNVLFELGLFVGSLGRERTTIVHCRDEAIELPSDLAGVTTATFARRSDENLEAALGPVCTRIKRAFSCPSVAQRERSELSFLEKAEQVVSLYERLCDQETIASRAQEAEILRNELEQLRELSRGLLCPRCKSPVVERGGGIELVEYNGRDIDVDHEWEEYECGLRIVDGEEINPCSEADSDSHGPQ